MVEKQKINEVIVVEGRDDTANLKRYFDCETYETGGSSIDDRDLERLKRLEDKRGIIVFTDPDFQGERIRKIIMQAVPNAKHAFLNRDEARPKGKGSLGVEHANFEALNQALAEVFGGEKVTDEFGSAKTQGPSSDRSSVSKKELPTELTQTDLMSFGLVMAADSRKRREFLCEQLRIGYANGKQIKKRLNMFKITKEQIENVMKNY
ncbi:ribonuclease M5 [Lactococcus lactis]|uniref:ribonuclease M5 n=1 Tax=Lactococcus lactis TaxID=1358 RepID=UPI00064024EF|nr:ribonuclease M5 [Lactococcus lactis]KLK95955.1 ribonuclease M5, rnmV [Lactococcus lactis subsp. lactis]MCT1171101.1 ribonuclease M5 [Lactococcus lactis]MDV4191736.1 ribonuclease M5 [Lactococcus lactis subsp. lactis]